MSDSSGEDLGELFVAVTGQSTIEEHQERAYPVRLATRRDDHRVSEVITDAARADGLDDALEEPDGS